MDFSFQGLVQQHASQMDVAFRSLVNTIIRSSKLDITLLRISNVTEDSFHVSLEARITKTGPASASMTSMTVDLCGPSGHFGNVTLPAITTQAYGTNIVVTNQLVRIVDKEALKAFIRAIIQDGAVLSLRNGRASVTAMGVGPRDIVYEKEIALAGMRGPAVSVRAASLAPKNTLGSASTASLSVSGSAVSIVLRVANPSPLEISFGTCSFDIEDHQGRPVAELKGRLEIRRDQFEGTFQGSVNKSAAARLAADVRGAGGSKAVVEGDGKAPEARLVGRRCAGAGWCDETVKDINVPLLNATRLFRALGLDDGTEEPEEEEEEEEEETGGFTKWTDRFMMR